MRILYFQSFPLSNSLSGHYVRSIASALAERKHDVAILSPGEQDTLAGCQTFELRLPTIPSFDIVAAERGASYMTLTVPEILELYQLWLYQAIDVVKDFNPEIIHVQHASIGAWASNFIHAMFGTAFVITVHGGDVRMARNDVRFKTLTRDAVNNARAVVALSESVLESFTTTFAVDPCDRFMTLAYGVNVARLPQGANNGGVRERHGLEGPFALLPLSLLTASQLPFLTTLGKSTSAQIVLLGRVGDPDIVSPLQEHKNIRILSALSLADQFALVAEASVFVSTSVYPNQIEPFTVEAVCLGKPLIVSEKGSVPGAWEADRNARVVEPNNAEQLAAALEALMADNETRERLGRESTKIAEERFTPQIMAEVLLQKAYQRQSRAHDDTFPQSP